MPLAVIVQRIRRYTLRLRGAKPIAGWSLLFAAVCGLVLLLLSWRFPYGLETEAVWSLLWRNFAWNLEVKILNRIGYFFHHHRAVVCIQRTVAPIVPP